MKLRNAPGEYTGYCEVHNKRLYSSRRLARRAIRELCHKGMREYSCTEVDGAWHCGHLPLAVVQGRKTAREVYETREATS